MCRICAGKQNKSNVIKKQKQFGTLFNLCANLVKQKVNKVKMAPGIDMMLFILMMSIHMRWRLICPKRDLYHNNSTLGSISYTLTVSH